MHSRFMTCFGTVLALTFSLNTFALTGGSEVLLFTPWSFLQKKMSAALNNRTVDDSQTIPSLDWQLTPWVPHLTNVQWNYASKVDLVSFTSDAVQLKTRKLSLKIVIEKLALDQIVEREIDGAILRVHVQAQCGPVTLSQDTAQMEAKFGFQIQPQQITTVLQSFNLTWAPNSWKVNDFQCQGPGGFEQTIKAELAADLASAEKLRPWLQTEIVTRAQIEADGLMTQLANPIPVAIEKNNLVLTFKRMVGTPEGIQNHGTLVWSGKSDETNLSRLEMNRIPNSVIKKGVPYFISPGGGWTNLLATILQKKAEVFNIDMRTIPAFVALLNSRSQQWAVWPDLQNYATNSRFNLAVARPRSYPLNWQNDGTATMNSSVNAEIQSQRAGKNWNYVDLSGSVRGRLSPRIANGKLTAQIQFSNSKFAAKMEPAYVQTFNPDPRIDPQVLQAFAEYVNEGFKYSATLPRLNLGFAGTATFTAWTGLGDQLIGMPMDLKVSSLLD